MRPRRTHPRIRNAIKWGGLFVTALLLAVYVASVWWSAGGRSSGPGDSIEIGGGRIFVLHPSVSGPGLSGWTWRLDRNPASRFSLRAYWGWNPPIRYIIVPLWMPIALSASITAAAWRFDTLARRRDRQGLCPKCNYPREGLAPESPCPECGTKLQPTSSSSL